jgi:uncharacterized Zn finger protein (UPF0148 family)
MAVDEERRREIGVERIGTSLLQGMVMTDHICPVSGCNMITMRSKDRTVTDLCLLCTHDQPIPPISIETPIIQKEEPKVDVSGLMAKKLLQGWTMMGECCSKCTEVPLMRSRDMKLLCVKCNKFQNEATQEQEEEEENLVHVLRTSTEGTLQEEEIENLLSQVHVPKATRTEVYDTVLSLDFNKGNLSVVQNTLLAKLNFLQRQLETSMEPREISGICLAIESCTKALNAVYYF